MGKKFDPLEYDYELVSQKDKNCHFQKRIKKQKPEFKDIIELYYFSIPEIWVIYIELINLNSFLKSDQQIIESQKVSLFVGKIKGDFDFQMLMKRICTDPELLIQCGS